jgi:hypothetical protein
VDLSSSSSNSSDFCTQSGSMNLELRTQWLIEVAMTCCVVSVRCVALR